MSPSQKRRRPSRTYQLESSSTNAAISRPALVASNASMWPRTDSIVPCRRDSAQASSSSEWGRCSKVLDSDGARREVLGAHLELRLVVHRLRIDLGRGQVRVGDPERVGVPERQQELAHRLADGVDVEAVARPRLLRGEVVPAERVRAVAVDHLPGIDDVAAALRHLLALGVEDQAQADAVAEARGVEQQRRLGEQRVEPAAGLVDRLADVVGGEALLEQLLVLERVVELRPGHRARVEPGVDHGLVPAHLPAALLAGEHDLVDVGAVQVVGDLGPA